VQYLSIARVRVLPIIYKVLESRRKRLLKIMSNILYPTTNLTDLEKFKFSSGSGVYVYDDHGKCYLEGVAGLWCASLGFENEELIDAIHQQYQSLPYSHMFGGKTHQPAIDLAGKLSEMVDIDDAKIFFGNSGSDANDSLLKIVRYYNQIKGRPEKFKVIARESAYHGVTMASASLTGLASSHRNFNLPFDALGVLRVDAPHYYRNSLPGESEHEFCDRLINQIDLLVQQEGSDTIAAFIAEPVSGAGGVIVPPENYFPRLQELLIENDILFLDDEVICGFGRTGNDFGSTTFGFKPDTMTLAKGLSSAYFPISASVISGDIYDHLLQGSSDGDVFGHGFTYSGHPVGCAAALKTIEICERDKLFDNASKMGDYMHSRLKNVFANHEFVGEIRGVGLIAGIEFVKNKLDREPFPDNSFVTVCQSVCEMNGLILRALPNNTMAISPPIIITESEIDVLIDILEISLMQTIKIKCT